MQNITNFKNSAFKLERKINVLVNESESRPIKIENKRMARH